MSAVDEEDEEEIVEADRKGRKGEKEKAPRRQRASQGERLEDGKQGGELPQEENGNCPAGTRWVLPIMMHVDKKWGMPTWGDQPLSLQKWKHIAEAKRPPRDRARSTVNKKVGRST